MADPRDAWQPEPHPVPEELLPEYQAEPYVDPWNSILERIEGASREQLIAIYGGLPTWRDTEIGDE